MNLFHPGNREITDRAIELCGFKQRDRILDLGCGEGETTEYLQDRLGLSVIGCDTNEEILRRARARSPKLRLRRCDGSSLNFPSLYFDGAIMECSFSLMDRQVELLHELYCVLKPGARLSISDLYMLDADPVRAKTQKEEALAFLNRFREHRDCDHDAVYPTPYLLDGMFVKESLLEGLTEAGFELVAWEDKTRELKNYVAQVLMDYGSFEKMWERELPEGTDTKEFCNVSFGKNTGYFLLVAEKVSSDVC